MRHTPAEIEILLYCHYSAERHPRLDVPYVEKTIQKFLSEGILEPYGEAGMYTTTMKGKGWVEMIISTPYPELIYADPRTKEDLTER